MTSLGAAQALETMLPALAGARKALTVRRPTRFGPLYRGLNVASEANLARWLTKDSVEFVGSFNSSSYHYSVAKSFAETGPGTRVILEIADVDKAVSAIYSASDLKGQAEMIIGKTEYRIVSRSYDPDAKTYLLKLEQVTLTRDAADIEGDIEPEPEPRVRGARDVSKFVSDGSDMRLK